VDRGEVSAWLAAYERAWRAPGTGGLARLFTEDAGYRQDPYAGPLTGLPAIAAMWEAEREGPDEVFQMASEVIAAEGDTAVARVGVWYGDPVRQEYRDLWVMRFAGDGRCTWFEEWPFWPEQPRQATQPDPGPAEGEG
jgi:ketosteroid isomerase-like protein